MSLPIAGILELDDLKGPFQPKSFYDSMITPSLILRLSVVLCAAHYKKDTEALKHVQRTATTLVKGLDYKSYYGESLRELGLFRLEKRRLKGDHISLYNCLKGVCGEVVVSLFSQEKVLGQEGMASGCASGGSGYQERVQDIKKDFFSERVVRYWNRLPKKLMESPSLEVFKKRRCGTEGHD